MTTFDLQLLGTSDQMQQIFSHIIEIEEDDADFYDGIYYFTQLPIPIAGNGKCQWLAEKQYLLNLADRLDTYGVKYQINMPNKNQNTWYRIYIDHKGKRKITQRATKRISL